MLSWQIFPVNTYIKNSSKNSPQLNYKYILTSECKPDIVVGRSMKMKDAFILVEREDKNYVATGFSELLIGDIIRICDNGCFAPYQIVEEPPVKNEKGRWTIKATFIPF